MDLIKLLQKLKAIKADPDYARMSRDQLLGLPMKEPGCFAQLGNLFCIVSNSARPSPWPQFL